MTILNILNISMRVLPISLSAVANSEFAHNHKGSKNTISKHARKCCILLRKRKNKAHSKPGIPMHWKTNGNKKTTFFSHFHSKYFFDFTNVSWIIRRIRRSERQIKSRDKTRILFASYCQVFASGFCSYKSIEFSKGRALPAEQKNYELEFPSKFVFAYESFH